MRSYVRDASPVDWQGRERTRLLLGHRLSRPATEWSRTDLDRRLCSPVKDDATCAA
jgi:hypothetical protein